jgi:hypothetical protein
VKTTSIDTPIHEPRAEAEPLHAARRGSFFTWRLQFGFRAMLVVLLLASVSFAIYVAPYRQQRLAADQLRAAGAAVRTESTAPRFVADCFGAEQFQEIVWVDCCELDLSEERLETLFELRSLRTLLISGDDVTDEKLARITDRLPSLKLLVVDSAPVAHEAVESIRRAHPQLVLFRSDRTALTKLQTRSRAVRQHDTQNITPIPVTPATQVLFDEAPPEFITTVRELCISDRKLSSEDIALFRYMPHMEVLRLGGNNAGRDLRALRGHPHLRHVSLGGIDLSGDGLRYLADIPNLHTLRIGRCKMSADSWAALGELDQVSELVLLSPNARDLSHLAEMAGLESLTLSRVELQEGDPQFFGELPHLKELKISESVVFENAVDDITQIVDLENLEVRKSTWTDDSMRKLAALKKLKRLVIPGANVTDASVKSFQSLPQLATLEIRNSKITDAALPALLHMKQMRVIDIRADKVTEAGLLAALRTPVEHLERIMVHKRAVSDAVRERLAAPPNSVELKAY